MALTKHLGKLAVAISLTLSLLFGPLGYSLPQQIDQTSVLSKAEEAPRKLSMQQRVVADILGTLQSFAVFSNPNPPKYVLFPRLLRALKPDTTIITLAKLKEQFDKDALKTNSFYDGKHLLLLATAKSVGKSQNGQTVLNLAVNPTSGPFLTITLQDTRENREAIPLIRDSNPVLLNCLYVSVGSGMVLRECQLERKLVIELLEQVVDEIELALFGKSTIPMAILNALIVEDIVKQFSDKQKYPNGAQICLKRDEECVSAVAYILLHSKVLHSQEKVISILHKLGYSQQDTDALSKEIEKLAQ